MSLLQILIQILYYSECEINSKLTVGENAPLFLIVELGPITSQLLAAVRLIGHSFGMKDRSQLQCHQPALEFSRHFFR